jgi:polysaccharide biosynthesis protein
MFVLVKTASDLYLYTFISVIGSGISCILNLIYCRKYLKLSLVWRLDLVKHFKPIIVLFSGGLVISIYANSDMLILEWFKGAYYVGLYAVAARVYTILKNLLASIYSVTIPRLSHLFGEQKIDEFKKSYTQILSVVTLILIPMSAGLIVLSREIILFLGGIKFIDATLTLQLLAISLIGAIFGGILTYGLNIPIGRETVNLTGALYGIVVNIGISLLLIPVFYQNGAAVATIASEFFIVLYNFLVVRESGKYINFVLWRQNLVQALLGFFSIIVIGFGFKLFVTNSLLLIFSITLVSLIIYLLELKLLKNPLLDHILDIAKHKFRRG